MRSASETRAAILRAAEDLFIAQGYSTVTVGKIAATAQVATQTVYSSTGGKAEILMELLIPAIEDPSVARTMRQITETEDPREVINATAQGTRQAHEGHWQMLEALVPQCHAEPTAAAVLAAGNAEFMKVLTLIAERLRDLNALRPDLTTDKAADLLWFHLGQDAWFSLVGHRHWSFDDAEEWLAKAAKWALLADPEVER
ncbi:TetR/AcrR family transcriptional regulator [Streptomyces fulvorobeus]|nr:TetR/AcrR family transcriptional regulator [Streptomyces fulvorobeus]NYE44621.1 AcrR family transcriptional regulator [Streptomyces fulvorobeus]